MDVADQDNLILSHLWVVKSVAHNLKSSLLFSADWDELISAGNLALVRAAQPGRFQSRNNCQFKTYAYKCVRGEMLRSFTRVDGHHDSALVRFEPLQEQPIPPPQEGEVYSREQATILAHLISNLHQRHREVIDTYLSGESLVQLAHRRGLARDRVMKWQRTGIKSLIAAGSTFRVST